MLRAIKNTEKLFVLSERRYGKTSLVRAALGKLPKREFISAYVDLWPTDSETTFVAAVAKAITESMSSSTDKLIETAKRFFGSLSPSLTVDEEGKPTLSFGLAKHARIELVLEEVLETPAKIASKNKPGVVVVLDEFQQLLEYGSDHVERRLRSVIQNHRGVSYIFLGSRKHRWCSTKIGRFTAPADIIRWARSPRKSGSRLFGNISSLRTNGSTNEQFTKSVN